MASFEVMNAKSTGDVHQEIAYQENPHPENSIIGPTGTSSDVIKVIKAASNDVLHDTRAVKKVVRRIDLRLMPILSITFSFSLIDRINLPNARIAGMGDDLQLSVGERYSLISMIFFVPYLLLQIPANRALRKIGPVLWLPSIALSWGALTIGMGFTNTWGALLVCRIFMGVLEAGYYTGSVYLISCWYIRYESQMRFSLLFTVGLLATGFGGILAYGLEHMDGDVGIEGWRWIFIIEGVITCSLALLGYFILVDFPDKSTNPGIFGRPAFLNEQEAAIVLSRIEKDRSDAVAETFRLDDILAVLTDWKIWHFALINMLNNLVDYSYSYFLPIILHADMGFSTALAQVLTFPPYVLGTIWMLINAYFCDRFKMRGPFIVFNGLLAIIGLAMTAFLKTPAARYAGIFIGIASVNVNVPAILSYQHNNIVGQTKRAVGSSFLVGAGATGGIIATNIFRQEDYPKYRPGLWTALCTQIAIFILVLASTFIFKRSNRLVDQGRKVLEGTAGFKYTI